MWHKAKAVTGLVLAGLVILFVLQNAETVQVSFLLWTVSMSRVVLIFIVFAAGIVTGWALEGWRGARTGRRQQ